MGRNRHKRKNSHVVIVTSDATETSAKQFRIRPWIVQAFVLLLSALIGIVIGVYVFEKDTWTTRIFQDAEQEEIIAGLEEEKLALQNQVEDLNAKIQILSETVTQKTESEKALAEQLEQQFLPTEFPLTGSATEQAPPEGDPMCLFSATGGAMVVATASGSVYLVTDDGEYGHNVWIDHGNGYMTIYRNQGEVKVKQGESVTQGNTLFLIGDDNNVLGYQMMKDGEYIDPMEMLVISG